MVANGNGRIGSFSEPFGEGPVRRRGIRLRRPGGVEAEGEDLGGAEALHGNLLAERLLLQGVLAKELAEGLEEAHRGHAARGGAPHRGREAVVPVGEAVQVQRLGAQKAQRGLLVAGLDGSDEVAARRQRGVRRLGGGNALGRDALRAVAGGENPREDRILAAEAAESDGVRQLRAVLLRVVGRRLPGEPRGHRGLHAAAQAAHLARQVDEVAQVAAREDDLRERLAEEGGVLEGKVDEAKKRERADEAFVAPADDGVRERAGLRALQEADRVRRHLLRGGVEGVAHRARHGELDQAVRVAHRPRRRAFGIDRVGESRRDGGGNRVFEFFHGSTSMGRNGWMVERKLRGMEGGSAATRLNNPLL